MTQPRDQLLQGLLGPSGEQLTCEECFEQLDRYVDLEAAGVADAREVPGMEAHLDGCPACREEHELLLEFVKSGG